MMRKIKILIVDDEPLARTRLQSLLHSHEAYSVAGEAVNGVMAVHKNETLNPDIILMDIRMPGMDGIEAARHIMAQNNPPAIIFITAYNDHALEAFDVQAIDYLLKPVRETRLIQALERASRPNQAQLVSVYGDNKPALRTHIMAKCGGKTHLIPLKTVYYFQADQKYTLLCHQEGRVLIDDPLKALESEFSTYFTRIHRSTLVANAHITGIQQNREGQWLLQFKDITDFLEISRRHLGHVKNLLKKLSS